MKSKFLQWFAIILIIEIGLLHILTAQKEYDEAAYMGYLLWKQVILPEWNIVFTNKATDIISINDV